MSKEQTQDLEKAQPTYSQRFTAMVVREFSQELGTLQMTPYQERLAQHLFIGVDIALKKQESDRLKKDVKKLPIVWVNVNMEKLAIDAVHRVELGLDALIPNHIHTVPYLNGKTGKYDLDLQIGYVGKDYYKRKMALVPPKDIIYHLIHESDDFEPIMKDAEHKCESYRFTITNSFNRGEVVGGFGYIVHEDAALNQLVLVSKASFDKSQKKAQSDAFWGPYTEEMQMVALVRRVTAKLNIDPEKVNASYMKVEIAEVALIGEREIDENANQEVIDVDTDTDQEEKVSENTALIWDPYKSEIQKRYGADKVNILQEECAARKIDIGGLLPREAHEKLLAIPEETKEPEPEQDQGEASKGEQKTNGLYVHCPIRKNQPRISITICENACNEFKTCETAQNAIAEAMAEERVKEGAAAEQANKQAAAGTGPAF